MLLLLPLLLLAGCRTPEGSGAPTVDQSMVVAAHPLAVEAGTRVLQRGGSAIDAAVAVQLMLGLVEPQSSGIGGGAIVMAYDASTGEVTSYLGRETAPASATPAMLRDDDGRALPHAEAMLGGVATGVPGAVAAFAAAHQAHGRLPWAALFDEAIERAEAGFVIGPRLARHIDGRFPQASAPDVVAYFSRPDGTRMRAGDRARNPDYADTLRTLAREGADAFYRGDIAAAIAARTAAAPLPGGMTARDLAAYGAETVAPLCRPLRAYVLCVPPPPTSGVGLLQLMLLLQETDIATRDADDPQAWFLFAEASRAMYADRDRYVGDPRFVPVPVDGLLDAGYLDARRALIGDTAAPEHPAGTPAGAPQLADDATREPAGTSHFVVVDAQGNAASVTTTVESYFGSGRMVRGFFLNNQLTDFSWADADRPLPAANAVAPGKRPRSSMTPAILLDHDGRFLGAIGSPGGNAIPAYIAKALTGAFDWNLPLAQALALPNLVARGERFDGEATRMPAELRAALARRGVEVRPGAGEDSGLHGVLLRDGRLEGAADPRREGVVGCP
ncbi:gamma-glutamyltransferase [Luteimonas sp. R10]|uniref:gamma-glutamyltransferase n=1 Tax=Luteimonas sp. R10 TaxID=3108176 RepID=UPI00308ADCAC|nr:gamma-glutamyltransferase [Luteimonas sp. R10]